MPDVSINEAILRARNIAQRLARSAPRTKVLIEGGPRSPRPGLVLLSDAPLARLGASAHIVPDLVRQLRPREVVMPALAERREDVPDLLAWLAARHGARFEFGPSALGLLMRAELARHVADLRSFVEALQTAGAEGPLGAVDLDRVMTLPRVARAQTDSATCERDLILDALRRHGFNRTAVAREPGIARKTLYNRMRRHGL